MSGLKIGLVIDDSLDPPNGVQQYVLAIGEWLRDRGHDIHYLTSATTRNDVSGIHCLAENVGVRFNGNRLHMPLTAPRVRVRTLLDREAFDILHVQMPYSPLMAGRVIAAAESSTAVVGTFHVVPKSWFVSAASYLLAIWCRNTLNRFDTVVSVSAAAQQFARDVFGIRSQVLPNAVQLKSFQLAKPFPKEDESLSLLFLGRLVPRKGCLLLLQALNLLKQAVDTPLIRLTICGDGPQLPKLKQFTKDHDLGAIVDFKGFVSERDKPRYYASADITVLPSVGGESFGISLVEAMASGQAVVLAGDNAGYRSILGVCPGDVLFDATSPDALAEKMGALIKDKPLRRHIAAWQQRHAETFDISTIGPRLWDVYTSALRHRRNLR